jgi:senataxin
MLFAENDMILITRDDPKWASKDESFHALALVEGMDCDLANPSASAGPLFIRVVFYLDEKQQVGTKDGVKRVQNMTGLFNSSIAAKAVAAAATATAVGGGGGGKATGGTKGAGGNKKVGGNKVHQLGTPATPQLWVQELSNMSTIFREWNAIHCLPFGPLRSVILTGKPSASQLSERNVSKLEVPPRMRAVMEKQYNESQMQAVTAGLDGSPMVLIQGPPGTGKTKTIMGLLSIILHSAPKGAFSTTVAPAAAAAAGGGKKKSNGGDIEEEEEEQVDGAGARRKRQKTRQKKAGKDKDREGGEEDVHQYAIDSITKLTPATRQAAWLACCPWLKDNKRDRIIPIDQADPSLAYGLLTKSAAIRIGSKEGLRARVLLCAPSNSALDEIVLRLITEGLLDQEGKRFTPKVVRVGVNIHHSVQSVALDTLVLMSLGKNQAGGAADVDVSSSKLTKSERDRLRAAIMEDASIICTTLAFSGSYAFTRLARKFDVVVVDEAAQAVEPSVLIPFTHGETKQVFLVGDPVQLPATVISQRALQQGYSESLFNRLQTAGHPVHILDTQYRMHPLISEFPARNFYSGVALQDGENVERDTTARWHSSPAFQPLVFYDVPGKEHSPEGSSSIQNVAEAQVVVSLYRELVHRNPGLKTKPSIAVISPYKAQVGLLRKLFLQALGPSKLRMVDVNTIDGFQGREKDITIFSTVRTKTRGGNIGFVADERRINVGLTRARTCLLVVGNATALTKDLKWSALVSHCRTNGVLYKVRRPFVESIGHVAEGMAIPEEPNEEDEEFVPGVEPGVEEEDDAVYSSDDELAMLAG